jgi:cell division septation protein DedD
LFCQITDYQLNMQFNIAPYLEQILFEHGQVALAGLGSFVTQNIPANVDYAGGTVSPPGKILTFNENLVVDDGLLTHALAQAQGTDLKEAEAMVATVVGEIKQQLDQREIVALPGIGRLYKNYVQKIQFLPDAVNFSRENYGLPQVQYSPIARSREAADTPAATPKTINEVARAAATNNSAASPNGSAVGTEPKPVPKEVATTTPDYSYESTGGSSGLPWIRVAGIAGILLMSAALGYYFWNMRQRPATVAEQTEVPTVQPDPANIVANEPTSTPTPNTTPEPVTPSAPATQEPTPAPPKPEPKPTPVGQARECILVVGVFKDENNIARLTQKIEANGMEVYARETKNGAQVIGARFNYYNPNEIAAKKQLLTKISGEKNIAVKKQ